MIDVLRPIIPGDDYPLVFTFTDPVTGAAQPQTGAALRVIVKAGPDDADAAALSDFTVNASSPDQEAGIIRATLPKAQTRNYPQDAFVYVQARRTLNGIVQSPLLKKLRVENSVIDSN